MKNTKTPLYEKPGFIWTDENFKENMATKGRRFLKDHVDEGYFDGEDGLSLHYVYARNPKEKGAVVICHGYCEFVGKYHEMMYYFYRLGFSVYFLHHRGHGYSERMLPDPGKVHVDRFSDYVRDFYDFIHQVVRMKSPIVPLYLFAHSMGGAIGALFLERFPNTFSRAVLSAPMVKPDFGNFSDTAINLIIAKSVLSGTLTEYVAGKGGFDDSYDFENSVSSASEARYAYIHKMRCEDEHYQTWAGTYGWARAAVRMEGGLKRNAYRIMTPTLLFQAGRDGYVNLPAQDDFARRTDKVRIIRFPSAKHEIYSGTDPQREAFWRKVFKFFRA